MSKSILILTNSADGEHTESVLRNLQARGESVFRLDADRLASGEIKIQFEAGSRQFGFELFAQNCRLSSLDIKSVWYRRPNFFNLQIRDSIQKKYAEDEMSHFLEGLWLTLKDIFWLNNPKNLEPARRKVYQLQLARELGFLIPHTMVSNDVGKIEEFFSQCNERMIFKAFYRETLDYGEKKFNVPTTLITTQHLEQIKRVAQTPCLFQEFIDKAYELRITIVGDRVFCVRIDSQEIPETVVDWRNPLFIDKLKYSKVDLPVEIEQLCLVMLKNFGLSFGAFDFVVNRDGQYYFLELNPNGQWYWLEAWAGVLISEAISNILIIERG